MGLRPGRCYREIQRAYTRKSKFKVKGYIKSVPQTKIVKFNFGKLTARFPVEVSLVARKPVQVRHNALESARVVVLRHLQEGMGNNFHFQVRVYPHHVLRENKMLTGAGADRMQTGMQRAFGKTMGLAAQVRVNQPVMSIYTDENLAEKARQALKYALPRMPGKYSIEIGKRQL